jgi:hypothetical protein
MPSCPGRYALPPVLVIYTKPIGIIEFAGSPRPPRPPGAGDTWYARLGLSEFILSGYPHLEEAYWFGEGVLPILQARGLWRHPVEAAGTLAPVSLSVN